MEKLMKNKTLLVFAGLAVLLIATGAVVYNAVFAPAPADETANAFPTPVVLPAVDPSVQVSVERAAKADTVELAATGLDGKYNRIGYEFTYESQGLIKGVNSGSSPIDVAGEDDFSREIYLGTCSRNVCTPDKGVESVSVVLEFTDTSGARSQFTGDFEI